MNFRNIYHAFFSLALIILAISCAHKISPKVSFVVNNETDPDTWEHITETGIGTEEYYLRKLKPGDLIYYSPIIENKTNARAGIPPIFAPQVLPVRSLADDAELKDYEKSFMLAIMGTNTRAEHLTIPSANDFRRLWSYVMNNLYCVKAKQQTGFFRVMIDYTTISALTLDDGNLKNLLPNSGRRDLVRARSNDSTIYNFFLKGMKSSTNPMFFTNGASPDVTPFSFISYSVHFNGYNYNTRILLPELNSWSVYDWIHSGVDIPGMEGNKKRIDKIIFEFHPSRLKVVPTNSSTGVEYEVEYKINQDFIFLYTGSKKRIKESDLRYIHPSSVRRMKFK